MICQKKVQFYQFIYTFFHALLAICIAWAGKGAFIALTVTSLYVYFCFSVFIALCIVFLTAGVPFHPKVISLCRLGFSTAPCLCKTRVEKKERDREKQKAGRGRRLQGQLRPRENKGPYFNDSPPAVLFMSCVLSLSVTFTSTLALSEGKQAKMPWCSIFHFPIVLTRFFPPLNCR